MNNFAFFRTVFCFSYYGIFVGLHIALMIGFFLEWLRGKKTQDLFDNPVGCRTSPAISRLSGCEIAFSSGSCSKLESYRTTLLKNLESPGGETPLVSVIIPVHNESGRIGGLLKSLEAQEYPRVEYIFVDDRSVDGSADLIAAFIEKNGLSGGEKSAQRRRRGAASSPQGVSLSAEIISLTENPGPNYKQYALTHGIAAARGDFLLFTDADCTMKPRWIRGMVQEMNGKGLGAAIGPVLKNPEGKGFFHLYQCFDHGVRYVYLAGAVGLGAAGGGFGNNLILRRTCLEAAGGYEMVPPSPTEDAALISLIRSKTEYKIRAALGKDVHVITMGENTWKELIRQTLRWNNGGLFCPDAATRFNYNFLMICISMGVLAFPLLPFFPSLWPLPLGPVTVMIFNTIASLRFFGVSLPKRRAAYGAALLFTPVYFTLMTILGYLGIKPKWKGKKV